jgi:hypothetical protein
MSADHVRMAGSRPVFHARKPFRALAADHVPFDRLQRRERYERRLLDGMTNESRLTSAVIGPRGGGKSGLIAYACSILSPEYVPLRVPIVAAGDPADVSELAAITLSEALKAFEMEQHQAKALRRARADEQTGEQVPTVIRGLGMATLGAKIGGGPIPAELNVEFDTLREQVMSRALVVDRLDGIDRLISILVAAGRDPVFVLEDTEAAVGAGDRDRLERFLSGPVRAYMDQVDAPLVLAIQDDLAEASAAFHDLAASMRIIEVDRLSDPKAGVRAILARRLDLDDAVEATVEDVFRDDAFSAITAFYDETRHDFRLTLAVVQTAVESAMDMNAELVTASHVLEAGNEWRSR